MATLLYLAPLRLNDSTGVAAPGIPVKVTGGTVYQDPAGNVPEPNNIVVSDPSGNVSFYAATGAYTLTYTPANGTGQVVSVNLPISLTATSTQVLVGNSGGAWLRAMCGLGATVPIRSNIEFPVIGGPAVDTAGATVPGSGVFVAVPIPVDVGFTVNKVSFIVGATAASTLTHQFGAIYSGTTVTSPPLIGQSTDGAAGAVAASARFDFTLTTPTTITAAQAPNGYIYAGFSFTASTTMPSVVTLPCGATATNAFRWFTNGPVYWSQTAGSALGAAAAATLVNASTLTVAPVVFLW